MSDSNSPEFTPPVVKPTTRDRRLSLRGVLGRALAALGLFGLGVASADQVKNTATNVQQGTQEAVGKALRASANLGAKVLDQAIEKNEIRGPIPTIKRAENNPQYSIPSNIGSNTPGINHPVDPQKK